MYKFIRKSLLWTIFISLGFLLLILLPSPQPDAPKPWEISIEADGNIKVLGIHLGNDSYQTAQQQWHQNGEAAFFTEADKTTTAEVFFDRINLSGLSAKVVINLQLPAPLLDEMLARAKDSKLQPSGARRFSPAYEDLQKLLAAPISVITYIANYHLDREMLIQRFGEPVSKHEDADDSEAVIWHYPALNMRVRLHPSDKPVLTYYATSGNG